MSREDVEAIADVLRGTDIIVISDEIYAELTYGQQHVSIANIPDMYERTVYVGGFSKSYAMTGWRMGYTCGPADIVRQMLKIHQYAIMCSPTTSQYAAIEALRNGDADIQNMKREYDQRRRHLLSSLREIGIECFEPRGAFYMFPSIKSTGLSSAEFCERFLLSEKVAVIPGTAFGPGGEGFVRMCYASSLENITIAIERMERFIKSLL
jgi:aminotransferase